MTGISTRCLLWHAGFSQAYPACRRASQIYQRHPPCCDSTSRSAAVASCRFRLGAKASGGSRSFTGSPLLAAVAEPSIAAQAVRGRVRLAAGPGMGDKAMAMDRFLLARILLTLVTIGYGALTVKADFNKTHATNPLWTGH